MASWYYALNGQTYGPVSDEALRDLASRGVLGPDAQIVLEGSSTWTALSTHELQLGLRRDPWGRYSDAGAAPTTPGTMPPPPPPPGFGNAGYGAPPGYGQPYGTPPPGYGYPPQYGYGGQQEPNVRGRPMASWWSRVGALLIDSVLLGVVNSIIVAAFGLTSVTTTTDADGVVTFEWNDFGLVILIGTIIGIAYFGIMNGRGQTLGKMALGITTVDVNSGEPIGIGRGAWRYVFTQILSLLCFLPAIINYLSPLWDGQRRAWHDKVASSAVVKARS